MSGSLALKLGIAAIGVSLVAWLASSIDPEALTPDRIAAFLESLPDCPVVYEEVSDGD